MSSTTTSEHPTSPTPAAGQLSLLSDDDVPVRFRLDEATVRRGRRHIAEIRRMLHDRDGEHRPDPPTTLPRRRRAA